MGLRVKDGRGLAAVALVALALAGCSGMPGADKSSSTNAAAQAMPAAEIRSTLAGRSWRFQGPNNTGTTLYAEDGSSLVEVDGTGRTTGTWMTSCARASIPRRRGCRAACR
jgi:hypothetical protein